MTQLSVSVLIKAPTEKVWNAFWQPTAIMQWSHASNDWHCPKAIGEEPKVGGIFINTFSAKDDSFQFDFTAKYDEVVPMKKLVYTIGEMKEYFLDAGRKVEVTFEQEESGIRVTEVFDAEDIHSNEMQIAGWQAILDNFRDYAESVL